MFNHSIANIARKAIPPHSPHRLLCGIGFIQAGRLVTSIGVYSRCCRFVSPSVSTSFSGTVLPTLEKKLPKSLQLRVFRRPAENHSANSWCNKPLANLANRADRSPVRSNPLDPLSLLRISTTLVEQPLPVAPVRLPFARAEEKAGATEETPTSLRSSTASPIAIWRPRLFVCVAESLFLASSVCDWFSCLTC